MKAGEGLRLLVFDRTCVGKRVPFGLTTAWRTGSLLYRSLGRIDATFGATSWEEALAWVERHEPHEPIAELQYWGHGRWGRILVDRDVLDASALAAIASSTSSTSSGGHRLARGLSALRDRLLPDGRSLVWLRTCETFGADAGHDFARRLADGLGTRVAGHTHVIGALQSGLHGLRPGHAPDWPAEEGIAEGTPSRPVRAHHSVPGRPRTITCFDNEVPADWFA